MGLVPFLPGQLVGGLAEPFHGFQFLPHGLHVDAVYLLLGSQQVDLAPPFLRGKFFAAGFQFFQIPGRRVIEDQFPAVALLEQFPLLRLLLSTMMMVAASRSRLRIRTGMVSRPACSQAYLRRCPATIS